MPAARARSTIARAASTRSGSRSERPTPWPSASRNVKAMPPPISEPVHAGQQVLDQGELVGDLGAAQHGPDGRSGRSKIRPRASSSRAMSRPAAAGCRRRVMAAIEACARWAAAKASST